MTIESIELGDFDSALADGLGVGVVVMVGDVVFVGVAVAVGAGAAVVD